MRPAPRAARSPYWHHPRFSSGPHGDDSSTEPLFKALYESNADLVLTGHDHDYERFAPQTSSGVADAARGLRQFVIGTGGKGHYTFGPARPNSEVRNSGTFGVLDLTLAAAGYRWKFRPEAGKTFTDEGSGTCH